MNLFLEPRGFCLMLPIILEAKLHLARRILFELFIIIISIAFRTFHHGLGVAIVLLSDFTHMVENVDEMREGGLSDNEASNQNSFLHFLRASPLPTPVCHGVKSMYVCVPF